MQLLATLATLAATASAATLQPRQYQSLSITNFYASCIPHSVRCSYQFDVASQPETFPATPCSITLNGPDILPEVTQAQCEHDYRFDVKKSADGGLDLVVWLRANSRVDQNYCHHIPADQLVIEDHQSVQTQKYVGPTEFKVSIFDCPRP